MNDLQFYQTLTVDPAETRLLPCEPLLAAAAPAAMWPRTHTPVRQRRADVQTLGTAAIAVEGERRIGLLSNPDAFTLLVLLALDGPVAREELTRRVRARSAGGQAYADRGGEAALTKALEAIEAALGRGSIEEVDGKFRLASSVDLRLDAGRFEAAIRRGDRAGAAREYRGDFLAGLATPEVAGLRHWVETTRRRLAAEFREAAACAARLTGLKRGPAAAEGPSFADLPDPPRGRLERLMDDIRGRSPYRVAAFYLMSAWFALQLVGLLVENDVLAHRWFTGSLVVAILGFPLAVTLAWARAEGGASIGDYPATRGPWPRWIRKSRSGHLAASAAVFVVVAASVAAVRQVLY